jgi:tetratricopeptide (TPR) repeat protein
MRYTFVADHYQYLASLALIAVFVEVIRLKFAALVSSANDITAGRLKKVEGSIGLAVLLMLGLSTWQQAYIYRDSETLWMDTLRKNPQSWMAYNNLGIIVTKQGNLNEGTEYFKKALAINPAHLEGYNNLGATYTKQGRLTEAIPVYEQALAIKPNYPKTLNNLGIVYAKEGKLDSAITTYRRALSISPRYIEAQYNLGNAYLKKGSYEDAIAAYQEVLSIKPLHAEALVNLGAAYLNSNSVDQALPHLKKALVINPDLANAYINIAYVHYLQGNYRLAAQVCENMRKRGYTVPQDLREALGPHLTEDNF